MPNKVKLSADDKLNMQRLQAAVLLLKSQKVIKRDSDIATDLHYSKPTVSQYINGVKPVTYPFIKYFEDHYNMKFSKIKIDDVKPEPADSTTRLLLLIAKKVGISDKEISNVMK